MSNNIWVIHKSKRILVTDDIGGVPVEVCITPENPTPGYYVGQFEDWQACQDQAMQLSEKENYPVHFTSMYWDTDYWAYWRTPDTMYEARHLINES